jgi:hypothetical protein
LKGKLSALTKNHLVVVAILLRVVLDHKAQQVLRGRRASLEPLEQLEPRAIRVTKVNRAYRAYRGSRA